MVSSEPQLAPRGAPTYEATTRAGPPSRGTFRPTDPTGRATDVTVGFGEDRLTVAGPAGSTTAILSG